MRWTFLFLYSKILILLGVRITVQSELKNCRKRSYKKVLKNGSQTSKEENQTMNSLSSLEVANTDNFFSSLYINFLTEKCLCLRQKIQFPYDLFVHFNSVFYLQGFFFLFCIFFLFFFFVLAVDAAFWCFLV